MTASSTLHSATTPCPVCDAANDRDSTLCSMCGAPVNLAACPQCEAINARGATQCWKCAALLGSAPDAIERTDLRPEAPTPVEQHAHAVHDAQDAATSDAAAPAASRALAPELPTCGECAAINAVHSQYCRTCNAPLERTPARAGPMLTAPDAVPSPLLDIDEEIDVPHHYIGNDLDVANDAHTRPAAVRARWRAGATMLASLVLLVLPALVAVGIYAHYRPAVVSHAVSAAKMRLHLANWAYVEDEAHAPGTQAGTLPSLTPAPTGIPAARAIPAAPTGIPGISAKPATLPPLERPAPVQTKDVSPHAATGADPGPPRSAPTTPNLDESSRNPSVSSRVDAPPRASIRREGGITIIDVPPASPIENARYRRQDARVAARSSDGADDVGRPRAPSRMAPEIASPSRDDGAPQLMRGGRGDDPISGYGTTSVCTPEIVDQGLCRPQVR